MLDLQTHNKLDIEAAMLVTAAKNGLPADVQELLVYGNMSRGIPSGILHKMLETALEQLGQFISSQSR